MKIQSPPQVINALSFDIEDWFHLVEVPAVSNTDDWPSFPSIVERRTNDILSILHEHQTTATFFYLGWIADRYPRLVRQTAALGHEIGSHSYWHGKVCDMTPKQFREDLRRSICAIESAGDCRVSSFRAPSFSITRGTEWAFDILREEGIAYDASLFPAIRENGGYPCEPRPHFFRDTPSGVPIAELPMSVMNTGWGPVCFSGGGYLRALPASLIRLGFSTLHRKKMPVVVYLHPRDFAPDCPVVSMPLRRRLKCYTGLRSTERKLRMLLSRYQFTPCVDVVKRHVHMAATS